MLTRRSPRLSSHISSVCISSRSITSRARPLRSPSTSSSNIPEASFVVPSTSQTQVSSSSSSPTSISSAENIPNSMVPPPSPPPPFELALPELTDADRAKYAAFAVRAGLQSLLPTPVLIRALTHSSFKDASATAGNSNETYQYLGEKIIQMCVAEYTYRKHPNSPVKMMESIEESLCGRSAMASLGSQFGIKNVVRWKMAAVQVDKSAPFVVGKVMQAIVGAIFSEKGYDAAKKFIADHILTREVDTASHLHLTIRNPRALVAQIARNMGKSRPVARILKETGRLSSHPVYVVGLFIDSVKISESYGSSLEMAEIRASRKALEDYFLSQVKQMNQEEVPEMDESLMEAEVIAE